MVAWDETEWDALARAAGGEAWMSEDVVVDHFGVAVRDLGEAGEVIEGERVLVGRAEMLKGMGEKTVVGRFVARRGEGLRHVALQVVGLEGVCAGLQERGMRLVGDGVRVGAGGRRYRFVHPESAGGALVELVEVGA